MLWLFSVASEYSIVVVTIGTNLEEPSLIPVGGQISILVLSYLCSVALGHEICDPSCGLWQCLLILECQLTISPTARLKSHVLALSNNVVDEFSCYWSKSRELGGKGSPRFPYVTPVVGSSSSDLLRAIISYCTGSHLEFCKTYCQRYTMELFCGSSQRS